MLRKDERMKEMPGIFEGEHDFRGPQCRALVVSSSSCVGN